MYMRHETKSAGESYKETVIGVKCLRFSGLFLHEQGKGQ